MTFWLTHRAPASRHPASPLPAVRPGGRAACVPSSRAAVDGRTCQIPCTHRIVLPILLGLLCGCAHEHFTKGHGDVGQFILEHAVAYGGHRTTTNGLPVITSHWRYSEDEEGVEIRFSRQQYPAVEEMLRQAFGEPQWGPNTTTDGGKLGVYRLTAKGGGIMFSYDAWNTQVLMLRPRSSTPKQKGDSP